MNSTRRLAIRDLFINRGLNFFDLLLKPLGELTHLDLSSAFHNQGMQGYVTMTMVIVIIIVMIENLTTIYDENDNDEKDEQVQLAAPHSTSSLPHSSQCQGFSIQPTIITIITIITTIIINITITTIITTNTTIIINIIITTIIIIFPQLFQL